MGREFEFEVLPRLAPQPCPDCPETVDGVLGGDHHAVCGGHAGWRRLRAAHEAIELTHPEFDDRRLRPLACGPDLPARLRLLRRGDVAMAVERLRRRGSLRPSPPEAERARRLLRQVVHDWSRVRRTGTDACPFCAIVLPLEAVPDHIRACPRHPATVAAIDARRLVRRRLGWRAQPLLKLLGEWTHLQEELATLMHGVHALLTEAVSEEASSRFRRRWEHAARSLHGERRRRPRGAGAPRTPQRRALARLLGGVDEEPERVQGDLELLRRAAVRVREHLRSTELGAICPACGREGVETFRLYRHLETCGGHWASKQGRACRAELALDSPWGALPPRLWVEPLEPTSPRRLDAGGYWERVAGALEALGRGELATVTPGHRRALREVVDDAAAISELRAGRCPWCGESNLGDHELDCDLHPAWAAAPPAVAGELFDLPGILQMDNDLMVLELARLVDCCRSRSDHGVREERRLAFALERASEAWADLEQYSRIVQDWMDPPAWPTHLWTHQPEEDDG